jgi:hypothetical protein
MQTKLLRGCLQSANWLYSRLFCPRRYDRKGGHIEFNIAPFPIVSPGAKELESNLLSFCKHPHNVRSKERSDKRVSSGVESNHLDK